MDPLQHYQAMAAFCRQRAKMDGEDARFWLAEAALWQRLLGDVGARSPIMRRRRTQPGVSYADLRGRHRPPDD